MTPLKKEVVMRRKRLVYFLVVTLFATSVWALNYWTPKSPTGSSVGLKIDSGQDALINGTLHVTTPTAWYMNNIAFTGTMTLLNAVTDGSVLTTQHYHSALSASDGSPNPALSVDATGQVGIGTTPASNIGVDIRNSTSPPIGADGWGVNLQSTLVEAGSGTHSNMGELVVIPPVITAGAAATTTAYTIRIAGAPTGGVTNYALYVDSGTNFLGGTTYINETSNANSTISLTINQGANDDEILSLKSSDVAHGVTGSTETDTYGYMRKQDAASGGLYLGGMDGGSSSCCGLVLSGTIGAAANTTHSTAGGGVVVINAQLANGAGVQSIAAKGNIFSVANNSSTQFIISGDGTTYSNLADSVFDFYEDKIADDVALISTLDKLHAAMSNKKLIDSEWEDYTKYNEQTLIDIGILGGPITNVDASHKGLVNTSGLLKLHNGAIRQLGRSENEIEYRVGSIEQRVAQLEMERLFYSPTIWERN